MHAIKRTNYRILSVIITIAAALMLAIGSLFVFGLPARADEEDTKEFPPTALGIGNPEFTNSSGGYPATATSWTGGSVGSGKGEVVAGIVDLSASAYFGSDGGNKKFMLDQYPEYTDESVKPISIFGSNTIYAGSDEKALLINTKRGATVAYAYKSTDMSLAPNSFYRFSVWVKTGDFASRSGATIKLSGLGRNCSFLNINTVRGINKDADGIPVLTADNNYGWVKYGFYVRTSASITRTVQLVLGIGDAVTGTDEDPDEMPAPAHGYAFFDTVSAERISAHDFATETAQFTAVAGKEDLYTDAEGTTLAIDLNEAESFTVGDKEIGTFSQNTELWETNAYYDENASDMGYVGTAHPMFYNSEMRIADLENNSYGFTKNPWAPYDKAEYYSNHNANMFAGTNAANILMISTYDGKKFTEAAYGVSTPEVRIERYKYYRFSVWVKGDSVTGGNGITMILKGKQASAQKVSILDEHNNLDGDDTDLAHCGWREHIFYLKGSMLCDYDVRFELWLGTPSGLSSGIAMFDNVTFTELNYSDYSEMSAADSGEVYSFDGTSETAGITNGNFDAVGDMEEIKFPMPVADWSFLTPDQVTARGFSSAETDTTNAVYGILPIDQATFADISASGAIPGVRRPSINDRDSVLLLSSYGTKTAFCYQSPSITLSSGTAYKITAQLAVDGINGYGASLVLKTTDGDVISTIENITDTSNGFNTYTFYLDAPLAEQSLFLEIWLGLNDRLSNKTKLSSGNVYVKQVALDEWTSDEDNGVAAEFAQKLEQYKEDVTSRARLSAMNYGIYSFSTPTLDYYDAYTYALSENSLNLGQPYRWSVTSADSAKVISGMFNSDFMKSLTPYNGFDRKDLTGNMLYIFNTDDNRTTYSSDNEFALAANSYYRIDVSIKVRLADELRNDKTKVGATIKLVGTSAEFKDIKDTTVLVDKSNEDSRDYETFKTYSFYISSGDNGGNIGLSFSLGGENIDEYIQGRLIVAGVSMTKIENLDYEDAKKADKKFNTTVELSETQNSDDDGNNTEATDSPIQWWIIPSILFGAALIAAIIIIFVMRMRDKIRSKRKEKSRPAKTREDTIREIEQLQALRDADNARAANKASVPEEEPEETEETLDEPDEQTADEEQPPVNEPPQSEPPAQDNDLDD